MRRRPNEQRLPPLPAFVGLAAGALLVASVFMPWYRTNLGAPTSAGQASGWDASTAGKAVVALAAIWLIATVLSIADDFGSVRMDVRTVEGLGWLVALCGLLCTALVGLRLARPPGPEPDFLSRDYGLIVAFAACVIGVGAGVTMASRR